MLQIKQQALGTEASCISGETAVTTDNTMAWHEY